MPIGWGDVMFDCECEEGVKPFHTILEGHNCKCDIVSRSTGDQIKDLELGVLTLKIKKWMEIKDPSRT